MRCLAVLGLTSFAFLASLGRHVTQAGSQVPRVRGVPTSKTPLYAPDRDFECLDGSLVLPFTRVNDDYCDCRDGSDEPGTAACSNGSFYCHNSGYQAMYIPSAWVNDGVCDCCDASDEYLSQIQCIDNCHELGREAWLQAQRIAELAREGNKIRLEYISQGKLIKTDNQAKLTKLRGDYDEAELTKKEREAEKIKIEERETAALEKYKPPPKLEQPEGEGQKEITADEAVEYFKMLDSDISGTVTVAELQSIVTFDKDRNGEVTREEALYFLNNREEITMQEFIDSAWANVKPFVMLEKGIFKPATKAEEEEVEVEAEVEQEIQSNNDEQHHEEDEQLEEEDEEEDEEEQEEAQQQVAEQEEGQPPEAETVPPSPQYDEETQAIVDEANRARESFREAERNAQDLQNEIRRLEERAQRDYGPDEEFASLDGQCFEYSDLEYTYVLCPFGRTTQRSKNGGGDVSLGQWNDWVGPTGKRYSMAKFDRGLTCWNGPARSCHVTLRCGMENKLVQVSEPSRCEYAMEFETPALCNPSTTGSEVHDEL